MEQGTPLQAARLAQLATMADLARHGVGLGLGGDEEYLRALRAHLARPDLRIFTYLQTRDRLPIWELVAPDTGTTAMYHERRGQLWSFFRSIDPDARMASAQAWWVEAIRTVTGWRFEERWQWKR